MSATLPDEIAIRERLAQIDRTQAEIAKLLAEQPKLLAEHRKLSIETEKLRRDVRLVPIQLVLAVLGGAAAFFAAGAAFVKTMGG